LILIRRLLQSCDLAFFDPHPPPMTTPFLPGLITLPGRNDDGAAKRARDGDLLTLIEEADARGWSSAVSERSLALRRRRSPASSSPPRGCGWVAAAAPAAEEYGCRLEEPATPYSIVAAAAAEEVDPFCVAWFCIPDLSAIDPPPLQPNAFATTDGGIIFLESRNDDRATAAADEHGCSLEEAATPDAVGAEAADEERATVDPYLSYVCLTL
jgi:hypothetical protein